MLKKQYILSLLVVAFSLNPSLSVAGGKLAMPWQQSLDFKSEFNAATNVSYFGGPVLSQVKVHLVFWGSGVAADTQKQLAQFYQALVSSTYMDQLSEYATTIKTSTGGPGTNQFIGRGVMGGETTITPVNAAQKLTQTEVEKELEAQIESGALPKPEANSLYMLHYPAGYSITISFGASCLSWFADHEVYRSAKFGNVYYAMFPCASGDSTQFTSLTTAASHELAEAVTDPESPLANQPAAAPAAWLTADSNEIGDLCAWKKTTLTAGNATFAVQQEWLNSKSACSTDTFVQN